MPGVRDRWKQRTEQHCSKPGEQKICSQPWRGRPGARRCFRLPLQIHSLSAHECDLYGARKRGCGERQHGLRLPAVAAAPVDSVEAQQNTDT